MDQIQAYIAEHYAENDRNHREAFDPAVGDDKLFGGEEFRENAVLRGRIGRRAHAHDRVGEKGMASKEHQKATEGLEAVGDEHHAALGHGVREYAPPGRETHVAHHEEELQKRRHPVRSLQIGQKRDGGDEKRIVGERRQKLRRHDRVETSIHETREVRIDETTKCSAFHGADPSERV